MIRIDPSHAVPIWKQIEDGIRRLVTTGTLPPGEAVPSVRDLSRELRVNPATVSKAYQRLTDAQVLTVKRGEGTFVSDTAPQMRRSERRDVLREAATRYAYSALSVRATEDEAIDELTGSFKRIGNGGAK